MIDRVTLEARAAAARARLEHARPIVDETLSRRALEARAALAGVDLAAAEHGYLPGSKYESVGAGGWESRFACPDCPCFRTATSRRCKACGSEARAIPAHERATA